MKRDTVFYIVAGMIAITLLSNFIAYRSLPDQMGIQVKSFQFKADDFTNYIPKRVFLFLIPGIQIVASIFRGERKSKTSLLVLNTVLVIVNSFTIYINL
ncbi:hypothetical protein H70357_29575 [Paenibacillus sp. FSL H7-0357]|jgi:hypothetical protein|nr:hypothetical protein H70357_29575 [Paenibacillus sp. FSL H7-0357]